jgi:hypothetical protein
VLDEWLAGELSAHDGVAEAPARNSLAPFLVLGASAGVELTHGFYTSLDLAGQTPFLRLQHSDISQVETVISFVLRSSLALGKHFWRHPNGLQGPPPVQH